MKKLLYFLLLAFSISLQGQTSGANFRAGVNFPFYTPNLVSIDRYLQLVAQSGAKSIRQMTYADIHWKNVEPSDNMWNFTHTDSAFNNNYLLTPIGTLYSMMGSDTMVFKRRG